MFNFKEAFGYLFKEKNWGVKFAIIYIANAIFMVPTAVYSLVQNANNLSTLTSKTTSLTTTNPYWSISRSSSDGSVALLFLCFIAIVFIPYIIVSYWYLYENIQAGIQKRHTKGIWQNKFEDTIKKAGKYFIVSFVYALVIGLMALVIFGTLSAVFCCGMTVLGGITSGTITSKDSLALMAPGVAGVFFVSMFCLFVLIIIFSIVAYLIETPAILRLIGTNTLSEGLQFESNWQISKKYKGVFLTLFGLCIVYGIIFGVISVISTLISQQVYLSAPAFGIIIEVIAQLVFALATTYFGYFVYTRLLGQAFRGIVKQEPKLKHVEVGE